MGRYSTGITTTGQAIRIELSYLLKHGYIIKDKCVTRSLTWTNDNSIVIKSCYTANEKHIELGCTTTYHQTKEKKALIIE